MQTALQSSDFIGHKCMLLKQNEKSKKTHKTHQNDPTSPLPISPINNPQQKGDILGYIKSHVIWNQRME